MKKLTKISLYTTAAALFISSAAAVTLTGQTISARVVKALSMTNTTQLNFGDFVPGTAAETIGLANSVFTP